MSEATWLIAEQAGSFTKKPHPVFNEILFEGLSCEVNTTIAARLMALTQCGRQVFKHEGIEFKCMCLDALRTYRAGTYLTDECCSKTSHTGTGIEQ